MGEIKSVTVQLPINHDAECAVIGSLLIDPDAIYRILDDLKSSDFYFAKNRFVYDAYLSAIERGIKNPDYLTICDELERLDTLEEVGGAAYLTGTIDKTPSAFSIKEYAKVVIRTSYLRNVIKTAGQIAQIGYSDNEVDVDVKQEKIERLIFGLSSQQKKDGLVHIKNEISDIYDEMDKRATSEYVTGIMSGFNGIDNLTGGFQKSDMIVVAARPSMGKTSLMLNAAYNAAMQGKKVAIFSLEMSAHQLAQRLVASEMGINSTRLRVGKLKDTEWSSFINVVGKLSETNLFIDDTSNSTASTIRASLRRLLAEEEIDLIIIDYLQLMVSGRRWNSPVAETTEVSKNIKGIAREFNLPVLVGSQLSRSCEQRSDKRPMLSDLRESGAIEQDADIVMFIYRDDYYNENTSYPGLAEIIIKKHRNGPLGVVPLMFKKQLAKFENAPDY